MKVKANMLMEYWQSYFYWNSAERLNTDFQVSSALKMGKLATDHDV